MCLKNNNKPNYMVYCPIKGRIPNFTFNQHFNITVIASVMWP